MARRRDVGTAVGILHNLIKRRMESSNPSEDVTGLQGRILDYMLTQAGDIYSKDIEEAFELRRATVSGYLIAMEEKGMILRLDVPGDRRLKKIVLTEAAFQIGEKINENIRNNEAKLTQGLTEAEVSEFMRVIGIMEKNMNE